MLNLNQIMLGTMKPKEMAEFYAKVFGKEAEWNDGNWYGWQVGSCHFTLGEHSEMGGKAKDPGRIMINLETKDVKGEFERIKEGGAEVVKEPYQPGEDEAPEMWIATFADPDGNYFQLMSPYEIPEKS